MAQRFFFRIGCGERKRANGATLQTVERAFCNRDGIFCSDMINYDQKDSEELKMQDDFRSRFADTLRRLRTEAGWTQEEVAQKLYVSDKTVSKWERGQSLPDARMLGAIAALFDCDVNRLTGTEDGRMPADNTPAPRRRRLGLNPVSAVILLASVGMAVAMFVRSAEAYRVLPDVIGIHFNAAGEIDGYGGKGNLWVLPSIAAAFVLLAILLHLVKIRWAINLGLPVYLDTLIVGKRSEKAIYALMSVGIGLVIGMMTAAFFLANEAMIAQKPLNFLLMIGLILSVIPITIVCVALGARIIRRERAEQRKPQ